MQAFLLSDLQIAPTYSFLKRFRVFLNGAILGFVKSRGVSPILFPSSIGFTVVKNTACLPLFRLFPPGSNPFLIMEFNPLAFPAW